MNSFLNIISSDEAIKLFDENKGRLVTENPLSLAYLVSASYLQNNKNIVIVASSLYSAQILYEQISSIIGEENCLLFPVDEIFHQTNYSYSKEMLSQRLFVMDKCLDNQKRILISHVDGITRYLPDPNLYKKNTLFLEKGQSYNLKLLINQLMNMGFIRVNKIDQSLQFALRGDILDIFPINEDQPIRVEFFDDEIESIRFFEIENQISIQEINSVNVFPATDLIVEDFDLGKKLIEEK